MALVALVAMLAWWAKERFFVSEETRVKRLIATMEQAVEQNKILTLADCIAGDYGDEHGLDKATLLGVVRSVRIQYEAMFIHITGMKLEVAPDQRTATATLVAKILTQRAGGGETELNAERVRLSFRRTDDGWKLTRAESPELKFD
jgi:hypothetical protein